MQNINTTIEAKIKQAESNLESSYRQYLKDIKDIEILLPESKRYLIHQLVGETVRNHVKIMRHARIHLRPFVTSHIRSLMALDKIAANTNNAASNQKQSA